MIRVGVVDAGGGLVGVDGPRDRNLKQSRDRYCAASENSVSRQKSIKVKSRKPSVAEPASASHMGDAASEQLPDGFSGPSGKMASSAVGNDLAALEFSAVQDAVQQERQRISRDLHDHSGQYLVGIALRLAALEQTIADPSTSHAFAELRQLLARFCHELRAISRGEHPGVPAGCDLTSSLIKLTAQWERETGIAVRFHTESAGAIEPDDATAEVIFRIAQEALTNIAKHATNASYVRFRLKFAPELVRLVIEDDGPGLHPCCGSEDVRPVRRGGLTNMQERLAERGGQLVIDCPLTGGTKVVATVPI